MADGRNPGGGDKRANHNDFEHCPAVKCIHVTAPWFNSSAGGANI
jgi:hypothetical protein